MWKQILFLGPPGVGKGTYARRVAPVLKLSHISPGDLLRSSVVSRPDLNEYLKRGELVPESIVFSLVDQRIESLRSGKFRGVILDGFPRSREQAVGWFGSSLERRPDLVIEFKLPEEILIKKLLGRRTCVECGDLYNLFAFTEGEYRMPAMLPQQPGRCDKCGGHLTQRVDDSLEVIKTRLDSHMRTEKQLSEYIKDQICEKIVAFHVKTGIAQLGDLAELIRDHIDNR